MVQKRESETLLKL